MDEQSINLVLKTMIQEKANQLELRLVSIEKDLELLKENKTETKTNLNNICDELDDLDNSMNEYVGQVNQIKTHLVDIEEKKNSVITVWIAPLIIGLIIVLASLIPSCISTSSNDNNVFPPAKHGSSIENVDKTNNLITLNTINGGQKK